jgi:hypothetical protein
VTPEEEATVIALWQEGLTCPEIAQRVGIPPGTARSRAYTLQQQGNIPLRPKGGRRVPALTRAEETPAGAPAPTHTPGTIKQWTVRLSQALIEAVKARATVEAKEPSHLVEEVLWKALTDRRSSMPSSASTPDKTSSWNRCRPLLPK